MAGADTVSVAVAAVNKAGQGPYSSPTSEDLNLGKNREIEEVKSDREKKRKRDRKSDSEKKEKKHEEL